MTNEESENGKAMKREFILAGSIFVAMAIVGTAFGLWLVTRLSATQPQHQESPPAITEPAPERQPPP